jgi:PAS domain S-box-containing protein
MDAAPGAVAPDRDAEVDARVFPGTSEMAWRCRAHDWAATPLGPVEHWPQSLRTAAGLVIGHGFPSIVLWGPQLVQIYNDGYIAVHGAKHPWGLGRPTGEVWPEVWHLNGPLFARALAGETVTLRDAPYALSRNGPEAPPTDVFVSLSFSPIPDEAGNVGGVLVTLIDTTAEVTSRLLQAEQTELLARLRVERGRLEEVFRHTPSFLAVLRGDDNVFELVNDAYYQLVGHGRELLGRPLLDAMPESRGQGFDAYLARVRATGEPLVFRALPARLERTPGAPLEERFLDITYLPLTEADGTRAAVIAHGTDVTDQVRAQRESERLLGESERARAEAEAARRDAEAANRAKADFLATMSHELRTPLNAIGGYAELLQMGIRGPVTTQQRDDLARIRKSQHHLLGLINEVLNYAKIDTGAVRYDVADVALLEVIASVEPLVAPQLAAKQLTYVARPSHPAPSARADREKVRQILLNLLSNAVKFTEPGGRVEVSCAPHGDRVLVRVADSGIGIPDDKQSAIFEPFVQVDARLARVQEGVGLGLAISRDLARGMHGDLTVESAPGAGSTFTLALPRA